jgi:hypothetical protein
LKIHNTPLRTPLNLTDALPAAPNTTLEASATRLTGAEDNSRNKASTFLATDNYIYKIAHAHLRKALLANVHSSVALSEWRRLDKTICEFA